MAMQSPKKKRLNEATKKDKMLEILSRRIRKDTTFISTGGEKKPSIFQTAIKTPGKHDLAV